MISYEWRNTLSLMLGRLIVQSSVVTGSITLCGLLESLDHVIVDDMSKWETVGNGVQDH